MRGVEHVYPFCRFVILSFALIGVSPAWAETRDGFDPVEAVSGVDVAASDINVAIPDIDIGGEDIAVESSGDDIDMPADDIDLAAQDEDEVHDPLESVNRVIFGFNEFFYASLLRPISKAYN